MSSNAQAGRPLPVKSSGYNSSLNTVPSVVVSHPVMRSGRRPMAFNFETAVIRRHKGSDLNGQANALGRLLRLLDEL